MKFFNTSIVVAFTFISLGASVPLKSEDVGKRGNSDACTAGGVCSSSLVCCNVAEFACVNSICTSRFSPPCNNAGSSCSSSSDCCSKICVSNVCMATLPVHIHPPNPQPLPPGHLPEKRGDYPLNRRSLTPGDIEHKKRDA